MDEAAPSLESLIAALRRQMNDVFPVTNIPDRAQMGRDPMDPIVGRYLEEELDRRVEQELARLAYDPSDWVVGTGRETVDGAHRALRSAISAAVTFPEARWEAMIESAASVACMFVAKPVTTLVSEVFLLRADTVSPAVGRSRARALAGHPAITERADAWLAAADEPVRRPVFRRFVEDVVGDLMADKENWVGVAEPLFALHQRINGKRLVPSGRLRALYDDLGLEEVGSRIQRLAKDSDSALWNEAMLVHALSARSEAESLFEAVVAATDAAKGDGPDQDVPDEPPADDEHVDAANTQEVPHRPLADLFSTARAVDEPAEAHGPAQPNESGDVAEKDEPDSDDGGKKSDVPLWQRFQRKINAPMSPSEGGNVSGRESAAHRPSGTSPATTQAPAVEKSNRPLWERYRKPDARTEISTETPADFQEVEAFVLGEIENAQRQAFIQTLFNQRSSEYRELLHVLADVETWAEATTIIADEVFRRNRVNIYSEVAIEFTNAVERRYKR